MTLVQSFIEILPLLPNSVPSSAMSFSASKTSAGSASPSAGTTTWCRKSSVRIKYPSSSTFSFTLNLKGPFGAPLSIIKSLSDPSRVAPSKSSGLASGSFAAPELPLLSWRGGSSGGGSVPALRSAISASLGWSWSALVKEVGNRGRFARRGAGNETRPSSCIGGSRD